MTLKLKDIAIVAGVVLVAAIIAVAAYDKGIKPQLDKAV